MTNTEMRRCPKCEAGTLILKGKGLIGCDACDYEFIPVEPQEINPELKRCPECGRDIGKMGFPSHMAKHRRKAERKQGCDNPEVKEVKEHIESSPLHICLLCNKTFPTQQSLAGHMSSHAISRDGILIALDNTEKIIRGKIVRATGDARSKYIDVRMYVLQAIDAMIR